MRYWRSLFFFAVGFAISCVSMLSFAGQYPATQAYYCNGSITSPMVTSPAQAASDCFSSWDTGDGMPKGAGPFSASNCQGTNFQSGTQVYGRTGGGICAYVGVIRTAFTCPNGGTLNGSVCNQTCPEGVPMQPDGSCGCASGSHLENGSCVPDDKCAPTKDKRLEGWVVKPPGGYSQDVCIDGCSYQQLLSLDTSNPQDERIGQDGRIWGPVSQYGKGTSCTGGTPGQQPDTKNNDSKKPPCAPTEGVMTTSTGKVLCVPEGTPDARKPDVKVKTKAETFPDGTTKETKETTTRDPLTGASSTSSSSTATGKPDGSEGQAGPPGTSTGVTTSGSGNGDGDGEGCDPTLNFCGGPATEGMYTKKEKTMVSVFTQFQNTIKGSALGSASTGFFAVSTPSGSCPSWSVQVPMLNITLNAADYFCNGGILAALQGAGYVMLALATYIAFTWAFL